MGDVVGATNMKIAPAAERVIPETYSLINDTFNISGSNLQFKLGVDTYAGGRLSPNGFRSLRAQGFSS